MPSISEQIEEINKRFVQIYINELAHSGDKGREEVMLLTEILNFQASGEKSYEDCVKFMKTKIFHKAGDEKISFKDFKGNDLLARTMSELAKINDLSRRIRIIANQQFVDQDFSKTIADSPEYVFNVFAKEGLKYEDVQGFMNNVTVSTATTSHPTNPASVEYTKKAMELAQEIADFSTSHNLNLVQEKMRELIAAPMTAQKKTQQKEVEEGLLYLKSIYNSVPLAYHDLEAAARESVDYRRLNLPDKLFNFAVWITGDGDGNPNSTEETLRYNIDEFRRAIKELYEEDLKKIVHDKFYPSQLICGLRDGSLSTQNFIKALNDQKIAGQYDFNSALDDLIHKINNFGYHFAKIDIRHESSDIMKTVDGLLKAAGIIAADGDMMKLSAPELKFLLQNPETLRRVLALDYKSIDNELVRRIFGRLKAIGENPDMSEKFIIAEFKDERSIQAVLFLLKATGNEVCNQRAQMNIVPLAEERDTLRELPNDLAKSLHDSAYLEHVKGTKKIYFMIAKSDTVRRGGVGAQEAQETAVRESIKSIIKALLDQGIRDLENYEIIPYNGGGHALQRGGGRMTELPAVYGRYALKAFSDLQKEFARDPEILEAIGKIKIAAPCFTVQGHQNYILFNPSKGVGEGTLRSLASQALYAEARMAGKIPDREVEGISATTTEAEIEEKLLRAEAAKFFACDRAVEYYEEVRDVTGPINRLFANGCWTSTKMGNASSRSSVRGAADQGGKAHTVESIKGAKPNILLDQRAIGAEKLCAHSGTNLISWFTWGKALQDLKDNPQHCSLNEMYQANKSMRDYMRSAAMSLYMTDFDTSWNMMVGTARPSDALISDHARNYEDKTKTGCQAEITPAETMSYIEVEAQKTAKLVYETMTGKEAVAGFDLLEKWPETRKEIDNRKKQSKMANVMQAVLTDLANENPQEELDPALFELFKATYVANDTAVNAPISMMLSLTRKRTDLALSDEKEIPLLASFRELEKLNAGAVVSPGQYPAGRVESERKRLKPELPEHGNAP